GGACAERIPLAILHQELLDVREIKRRDRCIDAFQVAPDGTYRFLAAKVTDDGNHEIPSFEVFDESEILFTGQVAAVLASPIVGHHQAGIGHAVVPSKTTA